MVEIAMAPGTEFCVGCADPIGCAGQSCTIAGTTNMRLVKTGSLVRNSLGGLALAAGLHAAAQDVAITEYMNDPSGSSTTGEWVELYNYGTTTVTLTGWTLKDDDSDLMTIPAGIQIGPNDFLILARDKATFEMLWLEGAQSSRVVQYGTGTLAMNDSGSDELVLRNASAQLLWRLAYGPSADYRGRATFYTLDDFTIKNHGTKTSVINRSGNDALTGLPGYEGNELTEDPWAYAGATDFGSPLRGAYTGANNPPPPPTGWTVDLTTPAKPINQGVRGLAIADQALNRHDNSDKTGIIPCLQIAEGSAIRGVAGGLYADMYDWKTRNNMPRPPTLEFLRWARDYNEVLYVTANTRGLTEPDPAQPTTHRVYYTSDTATLAQLAADWVRYTNHIVQTYRQGDTITNVRDAAILNELTWSSAYVNEFATADNFTKLLAPGETSVLPVTYWEIGNEPTISLNNAYSVTNGFTFTADPGEYRDRYLAITAAMLAEDPSIKVGPCVVNGRPGNNALMLSTLLQSSAQVDFISYHPYGSMGDFPTQPIRQQGYLAGVYREQYNFLQQIKDLVTLYRPEQSATMEYVASETNVSDFRTNNTFQEGTMAHALGSVETVMSFARLGLSAAHYWIWITATPTYLSDNNRFAVTMAFEKMRDELGDELVGSFDENDKIRAYVIRDSATGRVAVWAMNFSHTADINFDLSLLGGPHVDNSLVKQTRLQAISGPTNLFSVNLNPELNGGTPRRDVDWTTPEVLAGADPHDLQLTLPAATLTLLTIETTGTSAVGNWSIY